MGKAVFQKHAFGERARGGGGGGGPQKSVNVGYLTQQTDKNVLFGASSGNLIHWNFCRHFCF